MPSGWYDENASYRGYRIHVAALRYGSQHDGWWTLRAEVWHHGTRLAWPCPVMQTRFGCAADATRAGMAWGREAIDSYLSGLRDAEEAAQS
ncbi:DUF6566 family protein [Cupriavidus oxalaticus]|uniref:DUF6566 family protein n=1 Tax=Cupriavidus oxalaticus TaxID=96344 RepID=UPI00317BE6BB